MEDLNKRLAVLKKYHKRVKKGYSKKDYNTWERFFKMTHNLCVKTFPDCDVYISQPVFFGKSLPVIEVVNYKTNVSFTIK